MKKVCAWPFIGLSTVVGGFIGFGIGKGIIHPSLSYFNSLEGKFLLIALGVCLVVGMMARIVLQMEGEK